MKRTIVLLFSALPVCSLSSVQRAAAFGQNRLAIVSSLGGTAVEDLAAREVRRYLYLRTGQLLPIVKVGRVLPEGLSGIVVARRDRPVVRVLASKFDLQPSADDLTAGEYLLKTVELAGHRIVLITGGDVVGTLYGAYRFAEHIGVRFYLHGDVLPDEQVDARLPVLDEAAKPLFRLRGIQPFHDFPEGPDWWNLDDYKAIISQLPKMRMNFFALHTYPEGKPNAEPTVWIGPPDEIGEGGRVKASYPSSYQNTYRGNWGYKRKKTGDFFFGAARLFEEDSYASEVMLGSCPQPEKPDDCNAVFHRAGALLARAFHHAKRLGVKTCVGTETPLTIPKQVKERLKAAGKDPADTAVIEELYEGIFRRAANTYHLDYYWFWTPEGWTWRGASDEQVEATVDDLRAAIVAAKSVEAPFQLATCGWVLGPQGDRAMFDRILPPSISVSCINRQVGKEPVDPAFAEVSKRPKWAIPWLEDDPALTSPQLWVGRMRDDAADARRYGCTGLMGIHWRTRILGPNVAALAQAAWDQDEWNIKAEKPAKPAKAEGPVGGREASFPNNAIDNTDDDPLYQTVRYDVKSYHFPLPDGKYTVSLKFCEPHYRAAGKRIFGVKIQDEEVIEKLDVFATAGQNKALDYIFPEVETRGGWLDIEFVYQVEFPSIAAIAVQGEAVNKKVNCGGPAYKDYAADWPASSPAPRVYPRTADFFEDWAHHQFGPEVGPQVADILQSVDCRLPRPSDWVGGPGGLKPDARAWSEVEKEYGFVDDLEALRPRVKGAGSRERFEYWLNSFRCMEATGHIRCLWAEYNSIMKRIGSEKVARTKAQMAKEQALPVREMMVKLVGEVYARLLATVSNPGELGTVANWEQHILPSLLMKPGEELATHLGGSLPASARLGTAYEGPPRVIVPTVRTSVSEGESLSLKVILLANGAPREAALHWRPLGKGGFIEVPLVPVARGVHRARLPAGATQGTGFEYHVKVIAESGETLYFPATAPNLNQTVVVMPRPDARF